MLKTCLITFLSIWCADLHAQRTYSSQSVLASGNWYRISTGQEGVYKVDARFLNRLGINTNNLPSSSIRLYGNGAGMLPQKAADPVTDDLKENAIEVFDGGDGIFNDADYFLFYARSADEWIRDSVNQLFFHQKNGYTDRGFYFITTGGTGRRIKHLPSLPQRRHR